MAKKFAYVSFGFLCIMLPFMLGAGPDWNTKGPGTVVGIVGEFVVNEDGVLWRWSGGSSGGWGVASPGHVLPIPLHDVKLLGGNYLVSRDDEVWVLGAIRSGWLSVETPPTF